jgi:hypothetical protein
LARAVATSGATATTKEHASEYTQSGGLFLLLDVVGRETLEVGAATLPDLEGTAPADLLTFIVLSQCLGGESWARTFGDGFWRKSLRISPAVSPTSIFEWLHEAGGASHERLARAIEASDGANASPDDLLHVIDRSGVLPGRWAELCGEAAARAVRRFARRLPGFGDASVLHLRKNLLDISATIDPRDDRVVVTLSRAPLDLILRISGQTRGERRWPWLDQRPFVLFSGD